MSEDKPLHVQVAEALGWTECAPQQWTLDGQVYINDRNWLGRGVEAGDKINTPQPVPRFDTDWSATGPLIEKYGICLWNEYKGAGEWRAGFGETIEWEGMDLQDEESGDTPLIAVCNLILKLKEAGKL